MNFDKEYFRKWREAHREQLREYSREYMRTYRKSGRKSVQTKELAGLFKKGLTTKQLLDEVKKLIPADLLEEDDR